MLLQAMHCAWFVVLEKNAGAHGAQTRSAVAFGAKSSCSPGMQRAVLSKGILWFSTHEEPAGHGSQRPVSALPMVPAAHVVLHASCPGRLCHCPHGQRSHGRASLSFLKRPAGQFVHV